MTKLPHLEALRRSLAALNLQEKQSLWVWLGNEITQATQASQPLLPDFASEPPATLASDSTSTLRSDSGESRYTLETHHYDGKTYQLEKRRCGKLSCRCMDGKVAEVGHGPYWYAYWKEKGTLKNQYIGKRVPWDQPNTSAKNNSP